MNLAARSSFIKIRPVEVQPGWPPEKYIITYTCRGIASVDANDEPQLSEHHQVSMYMGSEYPLKEPYLRWLTPIWHPNIAHEEPHHVCTNNVQNWFAAKPLAELVLAMGEMVQYKHYHAKWIPPYPLDRAAADWVLEVAEPQGIVGPHKPLDDRPLLAAQRMRKTTQRGATADAAAPAESPKLGSPPAVLRSSMAGNKSVENKPPTSARATKAAGAIKFGQRKQEAAAVAVAEPKGEAGTRLLQPILPPADNGAPSSPAYELEVYKDGVLERVEEITKPTISIGRGALGMSVDLLLEGDFTMSRLHVLLERDQSGGFWLTVKGQNPVVVNDRVLPRERSIGIDRGQLVEICSYSIKVR